MLFTSHEVIHRPRSDLTLHFDIRNLWQIRTEKSNASARRLHAAAMPERWPQVCRVKITFELLLMICSVSTTTNLVKCLVNWNLLRIRVCSQNTQTYQKIKRVIDARCNNKTSHGVEAPRKNLLLKRDENQESHGLGGLQCRLTQTKQNKTKHEWWK